MAEANAAGVAVLARAPVAGLAKTRLIPALGAAGAARLHHWMIERSLSTALDACLGPVTLWWDGDLRDPLLDAWRPRLEICEQPPGNLGRRMLAAIEAKAGTLVIGTDCPALTPAHLRNAARLLAHADAVLTPAEDGGYVLIGLRRPEPGVFAGIEWGGPQVLAQTRARLAQSGMRWEETASLWDVDRVEDLPRLYTLWPKARTASHAS